MGFLIVFLGAGIGGAFRHGVNLAALRLLGSGTFPYGTLGINVLGSFLMGLVAEYFALRSGLPQQWRLFLTTGILGGFTTFSAFSLETALLYERGELGAAVAYVLASVILSVAALFAALAILRSMLDGGGA
ncbi:fluoride efflux transporter CrcB [Methylobacterium thuringiense]|uniref:Fluoride-specific ion channel FluC n=1 Tax=Methylobacterium thuringiense TaxID=1003091 RepID=A0ABQ4TJT5_9HYPH|nr:fluoride efflux transporter CrcB [Methylobacterium thuringiense]GJE54858.1 Putative fluoride ion transporter CrcB [Methylobacterium thuringiense]